MAEPTAIAPRKPRPTKAEFSVIGGAQGYNQWSLRLTEAMSIDDVLVPEFWTNIAPDIARAPRLKGAGDLIDVLTFDCAVRGTLSVAAASDKWVKVGWYHPPVAIIKAAQSTDDGPLTTKWIVGSRTFDVIRVSDRQMIKGGFALKEDALGWIEQHMKAMAA